MHHPGVVVVGEERDAARALEAHRQAPPDLPADVVEHRRRQGVEVGRVVGHGEDVEAALAVVGVVEDREAVLPVEGGDLLPRVVRRVAELGKQDVFLRLPHPAPEVREAPGQDPAVRHLEVRDPLEPLPLQGAHEPRRDDHGLAGQQPLLDARDDVRVVLRRLVQEDDRRVLPELRGQLHRDPDHPQERVEEVLARGVVGLVRRDTHRVAEAREERVDPLQRLAGDGRDPARLAPRAVRLADRGEEVREAEESDLPGPGEQGERDLLGVAVERDAGEGVDPPSPVAPGLDVLEVPQDRVALVGLQVLVGEHGVAGLGAGVDPVEHPRLLFEIEPGVGEVLVPVRVLDDDLDPRVDRLGGPDHQAPRGLPHQAEAEVGPAPGAPRPDVALGLRGREEEVVEDQLVEEPRREADDLLHVLPVGGIGVAELLELAALVGDEGDPARGLDPPALEEPLRLQHGLAVVRDAAAVGLEVDLADLQVLREGLPAPLEPVALGHPPHVVDSAVDGELEVAVAGGLGGGGRGEEKGGGEGAEQVSSVGHGRSSGRGHVTPRGPLRARAERPTPLTRRPGPA